MHLDAHLQPFRPLNLRKMKLDAILHRCIRTAALPLHLVRSQGRPYHSGPDVAPKPEALVPLIPKVQPRSSCGSCQSSGQYDNMDDLFGCLVAEGDADRYLSPIRDRIT